METVGLSLLVSASPASPSLPTEAGRREASEKLWGRCGPEPRVPRPFPSGACWTVQKGWDRAATQPRANPPQWAPSLDVLRSRVR